MECLTLYVLTTLSLDAKGNVASRNVGVSFDLFEAEVHKGRGIENDFETFLISDDWRAKGEQSSLIRTMRDFREMIQEMQEAAMR